MKEKSETKTGALTINIALTTNQDQVTITTEGPINQLTMVNHNHGYQPWTMASSSTAQRCHPWKAAVLLATPCAKFKCTNAGHTPRR